MESSAAGRQIIEPTGKDFAFAVGEPSLLDSERSICGMRATAGSRLTFQLLGYRHSKLCRLIVEQIRLK